MAFAIPSNLISRSDVPSAVQDVARVLRTLPDEVTLYYDVRLDDSPVWVIDPRRGLAAVRVVASGPKTLRQRLLSLGQDDLDLWGHLDRASHQAADVLERLRSSPHLSRDVPTAVVLALPKIPRSQLPADDGDLRNTLPQDDLAPARIDSALGVLLGGSASHLTEKEERAVRAAVTPEIIIRDRTTPEDRDRVVAFRAPMTNGEDVLAVLDREQHNLAMNLGEGYRVIRGVAGSGKSLVLTHRARYLGESDPDLQILLTCYNIVLGRALAAELCDLPNVTVRHIDSLAYRICSARGRRFQGDDRWDCQRQSATELLRADPKQRYDIVLVDEGQDFDNLMLDLAHAALRDAGGDFVVALDGAQNIFRKRARWNPPGQTARGRTTILRVNYRNTHEILSLAYEMLTRGGAEVAVGEGGLDDEAEVVPPEATSRRGPSPLVLSARDPRAEVEEVCDQLKAWHQEGTRWSDMLVLFGNQRKYQGKLYYACQRRSIPYYCVSFNQRNRRGVTEAGDVVRSSTIQTIKGVEFSHVAICGVNQIATGPGEDDDEVAQRRLLYVGMTRATDHLTITVSGQGPIGADLLSLGS